MTHFCTYSDHNYLPRALALVNSLERHAGDFTLWILCLNTQCEEILSRLNHPRLRIVPLRTLEEYDAELLGIKAGRKPPEYYFTSTPCWMSYLLERRKEIGLLTYLDSDLYFFSSPQSVFDEIGNSSISIIEHRHAKTKEQEDIYGRFNVGWISLRRDESGLACLKKWRAQCIEWCYDRVEDGKFADQKYLDAWPDDFSGVHIVQHPGANLAPWNIDRYRIGDALLPPTVDDLPVVFYHFSNMWSYSPSFVRLGLEDYAVDPGRRMQAARLLYQPYLDDVIQAARTLKQKGFDGQAFNYPRHIDPSKHTEQKSGNFFVRMKKRFTEFRAERSDGRVLYCPN